MSGKKRVVRSAQPKTKKTSRKTAAPKKSRMVGLGMKMREPRSGTKMSKGSFNDASCQLSGTEFVTSLVAGSSGQAAGDILYTVTINPGQLGVARLATLANLYDRYLFKSLRFEYVPIANATQTGQLMGYVDYDVHDAPTVNGIANLQRAAAHLGEKASQIWEPTSWSMKDQKDLTHLYTDYDGIEPRWSAQGVLVVLASSQIAANLPLGNIYLRYSVSFTVPQVSNVVGGVGSAMAFSATVPASTSTTYDLGTSQTDGGWSNLLYQVNSTTGSVSLPAGNYLVCGSMIANGFSGFTVQVSSGASVVILSHTNNGGTQDTYWARISSPAAWYFTVSISSMTTGSCTKNTWCAVQLPPNALTLNSNFKARRSIDSFQRECKLSDLPISKLEPVQEEKESVSSKETCQSSSSMSCATAPRPSSAPDRYVMVRQL